MATIKEVAKLAGVSPSTVSRALSNRIFVEEETRQRVLRAVEELGYKPNILARGLKQGRTYTLALLVPDINSLFYPQIMKSLEREAAAQGYSVLLCNNDEDIERERQALELLTARGIDGVLCLSVEDEVSHLVQLREDKKMPVVLINRTVPDPLSCVTVDHEAGGYAMTRYLLERGHRRIAGVFGSFERQRFRERYAGCKRALKEFGIEDYKKYFLYDVDTAEEAYRRTSGLLARGEGPLPTAFFASMDIMAIGVYRALSERGLRIPEDVSVAGFDNIEMTQYMMPPLTTYAVPIDEMAQCCVTNLLEQMEDRDKLVRETIPGAVIERASVRELSGI